MKIRQQIRRISKLKKLRALREVEPVKAAEPEAMPAPVESFCLVKTEPAALESSQADPFAPDEYRFGYHCQRSLYLGQRIKSMDATHSEVERAMVSRFGRRALEMNNRTASIEIDLDNEHCAAHAARHGRKFYREG